VSNWAVIAAYITGSLIVQNTITGDLIKANTVIANVSLTGPCIQTNQAGATGLKLGNCSGNTTPDEMRLYNNGRTILRMSPSGIEMWRASDGVGRNAIYSDGSGFLAGGGVSWNSAGTMTMNALNVIGTAQIKNAAVDTLQIAGGAVSAIETLSTGFVNVVNRGDNGWTNDGLVDTTPNWSLWTLIGSRTILVPAYVGGNVRILCDAQLIVSNETHSITRNSSGYAAYVGQLGRGAVLVPFGGPLFVYGQYYTSDGDYQYTQGYSPAGTHLAIRVLNNQGFGEQWSFQTFWGDNAMTPRLQTTFSAANHSSSITYTFQIYSFRTNNPHNIRARTLTTLQLAKR
jgi:hypothetical protein